MNCFFLVLVFFTAKFREPPDDDEESDEESDEEEDMEHEHED